MCSKPGAYFDSSSLNWKADYISISWSHHQRFPVISRNQQIYKYASIECSQTTPLLQSVQCTDSPGECWEYSWPSRSVWAALWWNMQHRVQWVVLGVGILSDWKWWCGDRGQREREITFSIQVKSKKNSDAMTSHLIDKQNPSVLQSIQRACVWSN